MEKQNLSLNCPFRFPDKFPYLAKKQHNENLEQTFGADRIYGCIPGRNFLPLPESAIEGQLESVPGRYRLVYDYLWHLGRMCIVLLYP